MDLVELVYKVTAEFPDKEKYGLTSQLQRASVSIPSNIAEGHGRKSTAAYLNHLSIAFGSFMEIETQIRIVERLKYVDPQTSNICLEKCEEIAKMLTSLIYSLKRKNVN